MMATVPTSHMEVELRKLFLRWSAELPNQTGRMDQYLNTFRRDSLSLINKMGGDISRLGVSAGFPAPKELDLDLVAGHIYDQMQLAVVRAQIMTGLNARESARALLKAGVQKEYYRLERLARTETVRAYWANQRAEANDLGLVLLWSVENGPRTCAWCKERDGMIVDEGAHDHPNGRCTLIPTLPSRVDYKGSVAMDGSIYEDPKWDEKHQSTADSLKVEPQQRTLEQVSAERNALFDQTRKLQDKYGANVINRKEYQALIAKRGELDRELAVIRRGGVPNVSSRPVAAKVEKLPRMDQPATFKQAYARGKANPNGWSRDDEAYRINCTRVSYVTEMRMRGYDISATSQSWSNMSTTKQVLDNWVDSTGKTRFFTKVQSPEDLIAKMIENTPDGARFLVQGPWKDGGAHIWNAEKRNGKIWFHEGQMDTGISSLSQLTQIYLDDLDFNRIQSRKLVEFIRVDDLEPTDNAINLGWVEYKGG